MQTMIRLTLGLSLLSLLIGCGEDIRISKVRQTGFVFCGQGSPNTLNPQQVNGGITSETLSPQLFDSLLTLHPTSHRPIANLAQRWKIDESGTRYTFTLRHDVHFHHTDWFQPTRPLNASDVVFSFRRIIDSTHPFHHVGGGHYSWFHNIGFNQLVKNVVALSDDTVQFILNHPDNTFLSTIATSHAVIFSKEYGDQLIKQHHKSLLDTQPIGTGPFYLADYQANDLIRLKRHPDYWRGAAQMEQVVFDISHRGTGTLAKLLRQECDVLSNPISSQLSIIEKQPELDLLTKPSMNISLIALNTTHAALNDKRVRKALNFAINRKNILDSVYYGNGQVAYSVLPPNSWAYEKDSVHLRYDPHYAAALLREAGYEQGLELTMLVPLRPQLYNPSPRKTAELIQANLADIGITVHLITDEHFHRSTAISHRDIDLFLTGWRASTDDPDHFFRPLLSCAVERSELDTALWCHHNFDFLLDLAREVERPHYRLNLYKQAQALLNDKFPVIPLSHGMNFQAKAHSLIGFETSPFDARPFDRVRRIH